MVWRWSRYWSTPDQRRKRDGSRRLVKVGLTTKVVVPTNLISRWTSKHPLHLSAASPTNSSNQIPTSNNSPAQMQSSVSISPESPTDANLSSSRMSLASPNSPPTSYRSPSDSTHESFTTAFAMLLYNVCYLAYTQCVEISLSQAGDALSNLWAICCSNDLGRRSHVTASLPPPTPSTFGLDFQQLLQATTASPTRVRPLKSSSSKHHRKRRENSTIAEEDEEGWDLMNDLAS